MWLIVSRRLAKPLHRALSVVTYLKCFEKLLWQGHQGSNPGPTVLETVALPAELYPYRSRGVVSDSWSKFKPYLYGPAKSTAMNHGPRYKAYQAAPRAFDPNL